jgi:hypothetical protein
LRELQGAGLEVGFAEDRIHPGGDFIEKMKENLD